MKRCLLGVRTDIFFIVSFAILADSVKEYVRLIEGQMNNDELFCYFINQLDYYEKHPVEKDKLGWYFQYLVDMEFFKEICDDKCKYSDMVSRAVTIFRDIQ